MKESMNARIFFFVVLAMVIIQAKVISATEGDYRSKQTGTWSTVATWEIYSSGSWINASVSPTIADGVITIQNGDTVTINATISIDQLIIEAGAMLTTSGTPTVTVAGISDTVHGMLTIANGATVSTGTDTLHVNNGVLIITNGATLNGYVSTENSTSIRIDSTGNFGAALYVHNGTTGLNSLASIAALSTGIVLVGEAGGPAASLDLQSGVDFVFKSDLIVRPSGTINGPGTLTFSGESVLYGFINNGTVNADVKFKNPSATPSELRATSLATNALWNNIEIDDADGVVVRYTTAPTKVTINGILKLTNGKITITKNGFLTNTNLPTLGATATVSGGSATSFVDGPIANTWSTTTATKTYPIGKGSIYRPVNVALTIPATPVLVVEMIDSNATGNKGTLDKISVIRYYQSTLVSGSASNGGTVKVTYGGDDGVSTSSNLVVAQCATVNGTYTSLGMSANDASSVTSSSYNPANGDYFLIGSTGGNALPVEISSLSASVQNVSTAVLIWSTATEVNNLGFEIERRAEGSTKWVKIGFVAGVGTSNATKEYTFTDQNLTPGVYVYRLKQIDNDGEFKYSASAQVDAGVAIKAFQLLSNYPNPFNPTTEIQFSVPENGHASLKVYNMLGQEVATLFEGIAQAGHYISATFDASNLASGVFYSRLQYNDKALVQRMLLMK